MTVAARRISSQGAPGRAQEPAEEKGVGGVHGQHGAHRQQRRQRGAVHPVAPCAARSRQKGRRSVVRVLHSTTAQQLVRL